MVSEFKCLYFYFLLFLLFFFAVVPPPLRTSFPPMTAPVLTCFYLLLDHCAGDLNIIAWSSSYREASHVQDEHVSYSVIPSTCVAKTQHRVYDCTFQVSMSDSPLVNISDSESSSTTRWRRKHPEVSSSRQFLFYFLLGFYFSPLQPNTTITLHPRLLLKDFESSRGRKAPASLALSLLEKTRAKFLFSSKCLLKSPAHTCQHRMQCTLVARAAAPACVRVRVHQTVHFTHKRAPCHPETDGDMCITCSRGQGHAPCPPTPTHTHGTCTRQHQPPAVSAPPPLPPPSSLGRKTFHIASHNHFLESGLTGCQVAAVGVSWLLYTGTG